MKKVITLVIVALIAIFGATQADAWFIDVTPIGAVHLDQNASNSYSQVQVGFNSDAGGNTLGTYVFSLLFDNLEMSWNSSATTNTPPAGLSPIFGTPYADSSSSITNFHGASFGADVAITGNTRVVLATVGFDAFAPFADNLNDVEIDVSRTGTDGFFVDGVNNVIDTVDIRYPVAPEPISSTLFLIGGATLGFRRFVRRKK